MIERPSKIGYVAGSPILAVVEPLRSEGLRGRGAVATSIEVARFPESGRWLHL